MAKNDKIHRLMNKPNWVFSSVNILRINSTHAATPLYAEPPGSARVRTHGQRGPRGEAQVSPGSLRPPGIAFPAMRAEIVFVVAQCELGLSAMRSRCGGHRYTTSYSEIPVGGVATVCDGGASAGPVAAPFSPSTSPKTVDTGGAPFRSL